MRGIRGRIEDHWLRSKPVQYSQHVNAPCCITLERDGEDATAVDQENHHWGIRTGFGYEEKTNAGTIFDIMP